MKKRFGIDIDGTVTCPATLIPYMNMAFNLNLTLNDVLKYELNYLVDGVTEEEFAEWFTSIEPIVYAESPFAKGAKEVLKKWENVHELYYISARSTQLLDITKKWFSDHELKYEQIDLLGTHRKIEAAKKRHVDIFLEDKHDNAVILHEECDIPVLLFDTPYNREPIPEGVIRVYNWAEADAWVENWLHQKAEAVR